MPTPEFEAQLIRLLVEELGMWATRFSSETMRAFDLGCSPWHGYLELSFLTDEEPGHPQGADKLNYIADWRLYNFTQTPQGSWPAAAELESSMQTQWAAASDPEKAAELFFEACARALCAPEVRAVLARYRLEPDFEVSVIDADHPDNGNYCEKLQGNQFQGKP